MKCRSATSARVKELLSAGDLKRLRYSVSRGRPYGSESWTRETATRLGLESCLRLRRRSRKDDGSKRYVPLFAMSPFFASDEESDRPARATERDGRPSGPREFKSELSSRRAEMRGSQPAQIKGHKFNPFLEAQASDHIFTGREIEASAR